MATSCFRGCSRLQVLGYFDLDMAVAACTHLRMLKTQGKVPEKLELALVRPSERGQYGGLYMFTSPARMMRPVRNLRCNATEYISTFEQVGRRPWCCLVGAVVVV